MLVFVAGVVVGVVGTRVVTRVVIRRAINHPELVRERIEHDLVRKLRLDADQQAKVHQVLLDSQKQLRELRLEFQPELASILSSASTNISSVLTPEQREKFEKLREENRHFLPIPALAPNARP
jgi:Spy/CpxP family protein refolding chaperone